MASWRDDYLPCSFRGVTFGILDAGIDANRSVEVHQFVKNDTPFTEDWGAEAMGFTLRAYVIGFDYFAERDEVWRALTQSGEPGTLVHPTMGSFTVRVVNTHHGFDIQRQNIEYFDVTFVEHGAVPQPVGVDDTQAMVMDQSTDSQEVDAYLFTQTFNVQQAPNFLSDTAQEQLTGFGQDLLTTAATDSRATITEFIIGVSSWVTNATTLAARIQSVIQLVGNQFTPRQNLVNLSPLLSIQDNWPTVVETTATRSRQAANQLAQQQLIQNTAIAVMGEQLALIDFDSYEEAVSYRNDWVQQVNQLLPNLPDDSYRELKALKTAVVNDINTRAANLERIRTVRLQSTLPALVLAYTYYNNLEREEDIIRRNRIRHPGFVPSGKTLQLLTS